ncbi:MAG: thiaminase II [Bryobacteraceae bacterium]|nr:thiaminase II [Bryobacteraceae bacterium]MDW8379981.1 thiaminase II [Bryobacterales bacterium]
MIVRRSFLIWFWALRAAAQEKFTMRLWKSVGSIYAETLRHPFLTGLADGSLPRSKFQFYLVQDALYLTAFSRALSMVASKSPRQDWSVALNRDAIECLEVERAMHAEILGRFGVSASQIREAEMAPTNYAYTNHLLLAAERGSFAEGLAAVLPCYWIYWEVGKALKTRGSRNPEYQRWISQYSSDEYGKTVERVLAMMDACARELLPASLDRLQQLFVTSARYEYQFWDMAWREERWAPC